MVLGNKVLTSQSLADDVLESHLRENLCVNFCISFTSAD